MPKNEPIFISAEFGTYTPAQLRDLDEDDVSELMESWVRERYQPMGRDFRQHSHRFTIPTPFDVRERLYEGFGEVVDGAFIEALAEKLQIESLNWEGRIEDKKGTRNAKVDRSTEERRLRREILQGLSSIEALLANRPKPDSLIGHNQPPELFSDESDTLADIIGGAVKNIRTELNKPEPQTLEVIVSHQTIKDSWKRIGKAIGPKVELATDEFAKQLGKSAGSLPFWYGLYHLITGVLGPLEHWIRLIGS